MTAVFVTCPACKAEQSPGNIFCHACGTRVVAAMTPAAPQVSAATMVVTDSPNQPPLPIHAPANIPVATVATTLRGRIMRDTNAGLGLINLSGRLMPFTLETHWRSSIAPTVQMMVDVVLDDHGDIASVSAVSEADVAGEKLKELSGNLSKTLQDHAPMVRVYIDKIGIPVLVSVALLWISWTMFAIVSVRIMASMIQSATMFDILRLMNSGNSLENLSQMGNGSSGLYGFFCAVAIFAPLVPAFLRHRLAPVAYFAPVAFLLLVVLSIYQKVHALASAAQESMGKFGGADLGSSMMAEAMKALSIGTGAYLSLAIALYLSYRGAVALLARR